MARIGKGGEGGASGELMQIGLLTLGMTGAGLLILFVVLQYWLVPKAREEATTLANQYQGMTKLFDSDEMQRLRNQAEDAAEGEAQAKSVAQIINETMLAFGLKDTRFGLPTKTRDGAQKQSVTFEAAELSQLLRFIVQVRDAKKAIEIESVTFGRPSRGNLPDGHYTASIDFVDYAAPKLD